ncbi:hypothetical protein M885DRAFT_512986 [Pelagophyceae sp. CCMP2097]|nr:hypothetical protein M885DRAFT_512986 [Pelagophyceae sp. CCMP2097]
MGPPARGLVGAAPAPAAHSLAWVPDGASSVCQLCSQSFGLTMRRHHCRKCGKLVCGTCSKNRAPPRYKYDQAERCCDACWQRRDEFVVFVDAAAASDAQGGPLKPIVHHARVVRLWEHQRWTGSWGSRHLLPLDPARYVGSNAAWQRFPAEEAPPCGSAGLASGWLGDWVVDKMFAASDADGWTYAFDFPEFVLPAAVSDRPNHGTFVRRRRWAREWAETDVPGSRLQRVFMAGDAREAERDEGRHPHKIDRALLGAGAALPSHDASDVRLGITVVEADPFEDLGDEDGLPAIGIVSVEPTALSLADGEDDDRDVYVQARVRTPNDGGPGWRATRWRRTGTVRTSVGSRKLVGGGVRVAVANPRAKVDVSVCLADTGAVLSEATFSVFELDASIEHDRVCAALDAGRRALRPFRAVDEAEAHLEWPQQRSWPLVKRAGGGAAGMVSIDGAYEADELLLFTHRKELRMNAAGLQSFSTQALRDLYERVNALWLPVQQSAAFVVSLYSFENGLARPLSTLAVLVCAICVFDESRALAAPPLLAVCVLLATLRHRASGAWARHWIERCSERQVVPWLDLKSEDDGEATSDSSRLCEVGTASLVVREARHLRRDCLYHVVASYARSLDGPGRARHVARTPATAAENGAAAWDVGRAAPAGSCTDALRLADLEANPWLCCAEEQPADAGVAGWMPVPALFGVAQPSLFGAAKFGAAKAADDADAALRDAQATWRPQDVAERPAAAVEGSAAMVFDTAWHSPVMQEVDADSSFFSRVPLRWAVMTQAGFVFEVYETAAEAPQPAKVGTPAKAGTPAKVGTPAKAAAAAPRVVGRCHVPISDLVGPFRSVSEQRGGAQPAVDVWLRLGAAHDDQGDGDDGASVSSTPADRADDRAVDAAELRVTLQLVVPTRARRAAPPTARDVAERSLVSALCGRAAADDIECDAEKKRRGPLAEFQAARAQVLAVYADVEHAISFAESAANLVCWAQPRKTLAVLAACAAATLCLLLVPLRLVLLAGLLCLYWDAFVRSRRRLAKAPPRIDARLHNFVRSTPDGADLASYFAPRTRRHLDRTGAGASAPRKRAASAAECFAGVVHKTGGSLASYRAWQRRYVVIDEDRRLSWWECEDDAAADRPARGVRRLAPPAAQGAARADGAPRGAARADLVVAYVASDAAAADAAELTHYLCAATRADADALRAALTKHGAAEPPAERAALRRRAFARSPSTSST